MRKYYTEYLNNPALTLLLSLLKSGNLSHAFLFTGSDTLSLEAVSTLFLCGYFCVSDEKPCLECSECKKVLSGTKADVLRFPAGARVLVQDVENMLSAAQYLPAESDKKFIVVNYAEGLLPASQNKLLKTLEEPNASTVFLLLARGTGGLLPTVLSRCREVKIPGLKEGRAAKILSGEYPAEDAEFAAAASGGALGRAAEMLSSGDVKAFTLARDILTKMLNSRDILPYSSRAGEREMKGKTGVLIEALQIFLRDAAAVNAGCPELVLCKASINDIMVISRNYNLKAAAMLQSALAGAQRRLTFNGNPQSIIDELLFSLLEVRSLCR